MDPLADYNPVQNFENYIEGNHNAGVYNSGNLNPYTYCYNSPVDYVDPNGKQSYFNSKVDAKGKRYLEFVSRNDEPSNPHWKGLTVINVFDKIPLLARASRSCRADKRKQLAVES